MSIELEQADIYFQQDNHTDHALWEGFDEDCRRGAIQEAFRFLQETRMIPCYTRTGSTPSQQTDLIDEDTTGSGDFPREDQAVYEQALFILIMSDSLVDGSRTGAKWITRRREAFELAGLDKYSIAPPAQRKMGWKFRPHLIIRG